MEKRSAESSAYKCIKLSVEKEGKVDKRYEKCRRQDRTLWVTVVDRKEGEVDPSTITKIDKLERKLDTREQNEGGKPKEDSMKTRRRCHTLSVSFDKSWYNIGFPIVSKRGGAGISKIGKDVTGDLTLRKLY